MSLLIPLLFVLACDRPTPPPQAPSPEKVAIPGTPLQKGGTRKFAVDVPHPFLETGPLEADKVGAKVSYVHAAK